MSKILSSEELKNEKHSSTSIKIKGSHDYVHQSILENKKSFVDSNFINCRKSTLNMSQLEKSYSEKQEAVGESTLTDVEELEDAYFQEQKERRTKFGKQLAAEAWEDDNDSLEDEELDAEEKEKNTEDGGIAEEDKYKDLNESGEDDQTVIQDKSGDPDRSEDESGKTDKIGESDGDAGAENVEFDGNGQGEIEDESREKEGGAEELLEVEEEIADKDQEEVQKERAEDDQEVGEIEGEFKGESGERILGERGGRSQEVIEDGKRKLSRVEIVDRDEDKREEKTEFEDKDGSTQDVDVEVEKKDESEEKIDQVRGVGSEEAMGKASQEEIEGEIPHESVKEIEGEEKIETQEEIKQVSLEKIESSERIEEEKIYESMEKVETKKKDKSKEKLVDAEESGVFVGMETDQSFAEDISIGVKSQMDSSELSRKSSSTLEHYKLVDKIKQINFELSYVKRRNRFLTKEAIEVRGKKVDPDSSDSHKASFFTRKLFYFQKLSNSLQNEMSKIEDKVNIQKKCLSDIEEIYESALNDFLQRVHEAGKKLDSNQGNPISEKTILQLSQRIKTTFYNIGNMRLKVVKILHRLAAKEDELKNLNDRGGGLQLIDYEKLRMHNQHLIETIAERDVELVRLKKKIETDTIKLAHVREREDFLVGDNKKYNSTLQDLDARIKLVREEVNNKKQKRQRITVETRKMRQDAGLLTKPMLVSSYKQTVLSLEKAKEQLDNIMELHQHQKEKISERRMRIQF